MTHTLRLVALAAVLVLTLGGCSTTGVPRADFQQRAGNFLDAALPILDTYAAAETDPGRLQDYATARAALEGLRDLATAAISIDTLQNLAPSYHRILIAQGDSPSEASNKVALYLLALAALEAALA